MDPAIANIGKVDGLEIWRINKFKLEPVPESEFGSFYDGDSYIALSTKHNAGVWDVHFWLGKNSTTDEMGTAAIKTVEIDQSLQGFPTQYREVQEHESPLFLSYFKHGISYKTGGNEEGFRHIEDRLKNWKPILFMCKGKRNVRCVQVPLCKQSLNLGDVFLLDAGRDVFVWMPPVSGRLERIRGMSRAKNIVGIERAGLGCTVHILDDTWDRDKHFWDFFGGRGVIPSIAHGHNDDENFWQRAKDQVTLWRCSDSSGKAIVTLLAKGDNVKQRLLDTKDAFIVDAVNGGLFVWIGRECSMAERAKAFQWGSAYLKQQCLPTFTAVTRVLESAESAAFTQWFSDWQGAKKTKRYTARLFQCSNKSGRFKVEEIVDFNQESLDGDDVMILDGSIHSLYVWVGNGANPEEKKHAENTAKAYLNKGTMKRHKSTAIETIYQGEETPTFKKFFPSWDDCLFKNNVRSVANMRKLLFE